MLKKLLFTGLFLVSFLGHSQFGMQLGVQHSQQSYTGVYTAWDIPMTKTFISASFGVKEFTNIISKGFNSNDNFYSLGVGRKVVTGLKVGTYFLVSKDYDPQMVQISSDTFFINNNSVVLGIDAYFTLIPGLSIKAGYDKVNNIYGGIGIRL
jgi:hypothetical protein